MDRPGGGVDRSEIIVDGEKVPLALRMRDGEVWALHGVCSHWGARSLKAS